MKNPILIILVILIIFLLFILGKEELVEIENIPMSIKTKTNPVPDIIILKFAHQYSEYSPQHRALLEKFLPLVQEGSNGKIIVEVYPYGQLGTNATCMQGLGYGTIEMAMVDLSIINDSALGDDVGRKKSIEFNKLSYLLKYDENKNIINQIVRPMGSICLDLSSNGFKKIFAADERWVHSIQDYKYISTDQVGPSEKKIEKEKDLIDILLKYEFDTDLMFKNMYIYESTLIESINNPYYKRIEKIFITDHQEDIQMFIISEIFWELLLTAEIEIVTEATKQTVLYLNQMIESYEMNILNNYRKNKVLVFD